MLALILGFALPVHAQVLNAPEIFCAGAQEIALAASICMYNSKFSDSGRSCETKLEKLTEQTASRMTSDFAADKSAKQDSKFISSSQDYGVSLKRLDYLIGVNRIAISEVQEYLVQMIHPVDDTQMMTVPCYGENQRAVNQVLRNLRAKLAQFEITRTAALANTANSDTRHEAIATSMGLGAASGRKLANGSAIRKGAYSNGRSDITGANKPAH